MTAPRLVIVTGMSGSGKTVASNALEDLGFFCIDNLPVELFDKLLQLGSVDRSSDIRKFGLVMHARDADFAAQAAERFRKLRDQGYLLDILFLDADDATLLKRYSETRRPHPFWGPPSLEEAIAQERASLAELRDLADWVIDTSRLTPHDLRRGIQERFTAETASSVMAIRILSFGFKFGPPGDPNLLLDVRFLPNPFFVEELRDRGGQDPVVADYVLGTEVAQIFLDHLRRFLDFLIAQYKREGKAYLTIAIGCTGGRHRSVAVAEALAAHLRQTNESVIVQHRDHRK
jgi:UPF0042 nucleotide-binding protein